MKKVLFLDPYPCIVTSDSIGNICFFAINPHPLKNKCIIKKEYKTIPLTKNKEERFPALAIAFNPVNKYFLIGDEFGSVTIWDLSIMLKKLEETLEEKKKEVLE